MILICHFLGFSGYIMYVMQSMEPAVVCSIAIHTSDNVPRRPGLPNTMGAKMVAILVHVHSAARESKYIKNIYHKCCKSTLLKGTVINT